MHEDARTLLLEFGLSGTLVGQMNFVNWLASIGINVSQQTLIKTAKKRGLPTVRWSKNVLMNVYSPELIERYVRAMTGVPLSCWLSERRNDLKTGVVEVFTPAYVTGFIKSLGCMYAAIASSPTTNSQHTNQKQVMVSPAGKMFLSRDFERAECWDLSWYAGPWDIYRYNNVYSISPGRFTEKDPGKAPVSGRLGKWATLSLAAYYTVSDEGKVVLCKVPATLLGHREIDLMLPAAFPVESHHAVEISRHVIQHNARAWVWVWSRGVKVAPVTLEPLPGQGLGYKQRLSGPGLKKVEIVETVIPDADPETHEAREIMGEEDD